MFDAYNPKNHCWNPYSPPVIKHGNWKSHDMPKLAMEVMNGNVSRTPCLMKPEGNRMLSDFQGIIVGC